MKTKPKVKKTVPKYSRTITINVLKRHIDASRKSLEKNGNIFPCPVDRALSDMGYRCVATGSLTAHVQPSNRAEGVRYELPIEACAFIAKFDRQQHVDPISFVATDVCLPE